MKKLLLSLGTAITVVAPIATIVACGSGAVTEKLGISVKTAGYEDSMNQLGTDKISVAGAWGDARFYAKENASKLKAVGVNVHKISNDGGQVRSNLKAQDIKGLQEIFIATITEANKQAAAYKAWATADPAPATLSIAEFKKTGAPADLIILMDKKVKSLFQIYSHTSYSPTNDTNAKASVVDGVNTDGTTKYIEKQMTKIAPAATAIGGDFFEANADAGAIAGIKTKANKTLKITFIPSKGLAAVTAAANLLNEHFKAHKITAVINVTANYNVAGTALKEKNIDMAFLPVDTWHKEADGSNFILQAGRSTQVAALTLTGSVVSFDNALITDEKLAVKAMNELGQLYYKDLPATGGEVNATWAGEDKNRKAFVTAYTTDTDPIHALAVGIYPGGNAKIVLAQIAGSYESWIYTNENSDFYKAIHGHEGEKQKWDDVKTIVKYGYTSTTSASSYLYPEEWFYTHFDGFTSF